jgi:hypothetical protein
MFDGKRQRQSDFCNRAIGDAYLSLELRYAGPTMRGNILRLERCMFSKNEDKLEIVTSV